MTDAEAEALLKRYDDAMMTFYRLMQDTERRDSRFMTAMRKYGLIQAAQALIETGGEAVTSLGRELQTRTVKAPPAPNERAALVMERINKDRVIMAQQRAAGTMSEAEYGKAMRELDQLAAMAAEWT